MAGLQVPPAVPGLKCGVICKTSSERNGSSILVRRTPLSVSAKTILDRLRSYLTGRTLLKNVAMLAGGTALAHAMMVLSSPVITRIYTSAAFGLFALYNSFLAVLSSIATLRYSATIPLPKEERIATSVVVLCLVIAVVEVAVCSVIFLLFGEKLTVLINASAITPYLWALPLGILASGAFDALNYWAVRKKTFKAVSQSRLSQAAATITGQTSFGLMNLGGLGLIAGDLIGRAVGLIQLGMKALQGHFALMKSTTVKDLYEVARRYRPFSFFSSSATLANTVTLQFPVILLASYYGLAVAGWFALATRIVWGPLTALRTAVGDVYLSEAAVFVREDSDNLHAFYRSIVRKLFWVEAMPTALLSLTCPLWFGLVFTSGWKETGMYALIGFPMYVVGFLEYPASQTFVVLDLAWVQFTWGILRTIATLGAMWAVAGHRHSARSAICAYTFTMALAYIAYHIAAEMAAKGHSMKNARIGFPTALWCPVLSQDQNEP